ncbi:hypothetical protein [Devosia sp. 2618]|uniref:hypothetical protein n=1 Tax=Devosia sp. 2618 TaxID=3156454 RepID=UPI00339ABB37
MVFDTIRDRTTDADDVTPGQIASNNLFTAKEKLALLNQIKADATGAEQEGRAFEFDAEEIERAIAVVRESVETGVSVDTIIKGDF